MWVAFAVQKLLAFFSAKNIRILYIESAKTVNEMTLNELVKLTTLWTTGPSIIYIIYHFIDFFYRTYNLLALTLSALQTKTDTFANGIDPDEMAHNEPSHQDLHFLPFCSWILTGTPFATVDMSKFKAGRGHFRNLRVKELDFILFTLFFIQFSTK